MPRLPVDPNWAENGYYRYICEAGHRSVTTNQYYDKCTARSQGVGMVDGPECGADIEYRVIPYA